MAGTTDFLTFNPGQVNQETDSQWSSDAQRTGGISSGAIIPSTMLNKALNQATVMVAALGQMLATKGYSTSDSNQNQLAAVLAAILTQADLPTPLVTLPYASSVTFDASQTRGWDITLSGNITSSSLVNTAPGQILTFVLRQTSSGNMTVAWPNSMALNAPQPYATGGYVSIFSVIVTMDGSVRPYTEMTYS